MPDKQVRGNGQDEIVRNPSSVYCPFRRQQRKSKSVGFYHSTRHKNQRAIPGVYSIIRCMYQHVLTENNGVKTAAPSLLSVKGGI